MPKFEFKNYDLELEIGDCAFCVTCTAELTDKIQGFSKNAKELAEKVGKGEKTAGDAIGFFETVTDETLGAGAFEKIFKNRRATVYDCADMLLFVFSEIGKFTKERMSAYPGVRA